MPPSKFADQQAYAWIDTTCIPSLSQTNVLILFGAGQGSVDFLTYRHRTNGRYTVACIADNDASMHGKDLLGVPIIPPQEIPRTHHDTIIVTTISGKEAVTLQLEAMGYASNSDFHCIGAYPSAAKNNFETALYFDSITPFLEPGRTILHVGPGGFLGLECLLYVMGVTPISLDAYSFGADYPVVTKKFEEYRSLCQFFKTQPSMPPTFIPQRFADLFSRNADDVILNSTKIPYLFPYRFSALPLDDDAVDAVLSFAVLEHVHNPAQSVREIHRVLKPGGLALQRIITRDHRSFGKVEGYHPFSYLEHSQEQWDKLTRDKFYQNRILPRAWQNIFEANGFEILLFRPLETSHLDPATAKRILAMNPDLTEMDLGAVNCDVIARKR